MPDSDRMLIVDGLQFHNWDREVFELVRAGGISCINATCAIWEGARETLDTIGLWRRLFVEHSDLISSATNALEVREAAAAGKTAIILGFQNTSPIEADIDLIGLYESLGVRIIQLTYNTQNLVGSGCYEDHDGGLSWFGREVIKEMNNVGLLVDLSHVGDQTCLDTASITTAPIAITHANPRWAKDRKRNKPDEVLRAVAETGGVVGLAVYPPLLPNGAATTLNQFCEMVARVAELIGSEHVGIGTDYHLKHSPDVHRYWLTGKWTRTIPSFVDIIPQGWQGEEMQWPEWFKVPADMDNIATGLHAVGFADKDVRGILGENWLRLFDQVFPATKTK